MGGNARRRSLGIVALWLTLGVAGCGSLNPVSWFGSKPPPPAPLENIERPIPVRVLWQARVNASPGIAFTPAVVNGSVYVAAQDGTVVRLEELSGKEIWRVSAGPSLSAGVGADAQLVVVGTTEGEVIALDSSGVVVWRARVSSEVLSAPAVAGDLVVVRSADSRIFAFDARDGKRRWIYQRAASALSVRNAAGLVVRGGLVFAGFAGGKLVAISLSNGGLRWEGTVALPKGTTELERVSDVIGMPWVGERAVCAVAFQGRVACFDLSNGNQLWARDMSSSSGLDVDDRSIYVSEDRGAVSALDRKTGTSLWRQDRLENRNLSGPLAVQEAIVVGDLQGQVHIMSRDSGQFIGRQATDNSPILAGPVRLADGFLVQTTNGGLYALGL